VLLQSGLTVSNFAHTSGNANSVYEVAAVVCGVEQEKCAPVKRWEHIDGANNPYWSIPVKPAYDRNGKDASSHYALNDVSVTDLTGDGKMEFIVKRPCDAAGDPAQKIMYHHVDCYDMEGNQLWWIDMGPNMIGGPDEQWDVVAFDWDMDGKAEVLFRAADGTVIHYPDGSTYEIGNMTVDTRWAGIEYTPTGIERECIVLKSGRGRIFTSYGCKMNNWTKNQPCFSGDIMGDWREELVLRAGDNTELRIYPTTIPTEYRIPTLWHDHQYRQGMMWQCMGYNQPAHTSFFLGELEGITQAPPPLINTDRTMVANGGQITTTDDHLLVSPDEDATVSIANGASHYMVTFNIPSWTQGQAGSNQTARPEPVTTYYKCVVTGGALTGNTRVVKQGDGILTLPKADMTYTGETDVWAGVLNFDGSLRNSPLWLNRFAEHQRRGGMLCTGALTVAKGAMLSGKGVLTNSTTTISSGATLRSGITETNALGNLQFSGKNLTVVGTISTFVGSRTSYSKFTNT